MPKPIKPHVDPGLARQDSFPGAPWQVLQTQPGGVAGGHRLWPLLPPRHQQAAVSCTHGSLQKFAPLPAMLASLRWRTTSAVTKTESSAGGRCGARARHQAGPVARCRLMPTDHVPLQLNIRNRGALRFVAWGWHLQECRLSEAEAEVAAAAEAQICNVLLPLPTRSSSLRRPARPPLAPLRPRAPLLPAQPLRPAAVALSDCSTEAHPPAGLPPPYALYARQAAPVARALSQHGTRRTLKCPPHNARQKLSAPAAAGGGTHASSGGWCQRCCIWRLEGPLPHPAAHFSDPASL